LHKGWQKTATIPHLPAMGLHLWRLDLADVDRAGLTRDARLVLNASELARAEQFRVDQARDEFVAARLLLRRLLGDASGVHPGAIVFRNGPNGKPYLPATPGLEFNVSHSKGMIFVAISRAGVVGVDVELVDPAFGASGDLLPIARTAFLQEEILQIEREPSELKKLRAFYRFWTRKEAVAKADGRGIAEPLDYSVVETDHESECRVIIKASYGAVEMIYFVQLHAVADDFIAAVATRHSGQPSSPFDAGWLFS